MGFVAAKVFWFVAEPPHLILIAFVVAGLLWLTPWRRFSGPIAAAAATLYGAIIVLPLGTWLMLPLEARFPPPASPPPHVDGVIVLGGAVEPRLSLLRGQPQLNDSGERMLAMLELARRYPEAKLVFTGGSGRLVDAEAREADTAKDLMTRVGLPSERVIYERDSRDTAENAVMSKAIVKPRPGETWLLVTSAWHMPRAVGVFRQAGWPVVAWPVDYASEGDSAWRINVSGLEGQRRFKVALREWIGLIAYRLMGRTDQLFPSP
jgi:uncharacterized SAM-binding protein YcdF (DUF218 family)